MKRNSVYFIGPIVSIFLFLLIYIIISAHKEESGQHKFRPHQKEVDIQEKVVRKEGTTEAKTYEGKWRPLHVNPNGIWLYMYELDGKEYIVTNTMSIVEHKKSQ